jgi:hypothetical protein
MKVPSTRVLVIAALAVGAALRFWHLDREGLWLDELFTARVVTRESWAGLRAELAGDVHPPLYFALLRVWSMVAGTSDVALRLPSVVAGVATIPLVARLADRLYGRVAAAPAAWLLALAPFAVGLDREARGNALFGLLALVGCVLVVDARDARRGAPLAYALVAAALLYTHVFGAFVLLVHALWLLTEAFAPPGPAGAADPDVRGVLRPWLGALAAAGLAFLPWVGVLAKQVQTFSAAPWYTAPAPDSVAWLGLGISADAPALALGLGAAVVVALATAPDGRGARFLTCSVLGLVLVPQAISYAASPILRDRNVYPLLAVAVAVAAGGFVAARSAAAGRAALVLFLGMEGVATARLRFGLDEGEQWREAAALVAAGWQDGDRLLANHPQLWRHYLPERISPEEATVAAASERSGKRTWLLLAHAIDPAVVDALTTRQSLLSDTSLRAARVLAVDPLTVPVSLGADLGPPVRDGDALHFYWNLAVRSAPLAVTGSCAVGVTARGETAEGVPARLALRVIAGESVLGETFVDLPDKAEALWGSPVAFDGTDRVEVAFVNDGTTAAGADRNAHVDRVVVRCVR